MIEDNVDKSMSRALIVDQKLNASQHNFHNWQLNSLTADRRMRKTTKSPLRLRLEREISSSISDASTWLVMTAPVLVLIM